MYSEYVGKIEKMYKYKCSQFKALAVGAYETSPT
jgi:hypothetical protein